MTQYKSFDQILSEVNSLGGDISAAEEDNLEMWEADNTPLVEAEAIDILMHRDAHFGGRFDIMIEVYSKEKAGAVLDVSCEEIERLAQMEKRFRR